ARGRGPRRRRRRLLRRGERDAAYRGHRRPDDGRRAAAGRHRGRTGDGRGLRRAARAGARGLLHRQLGELPGHPRAGGTGREPGTVSATRLLVLGAVRIFQPAHGYLVRRELLSWDVENWAAINPGSIYNMLRTLTRDGLLEEVDTADVGKGPARVAYRLTADGETAFLGLLTSA